MKRRGFIRALFIGWSLIAACFEAAALSKLLPPEPVNLRGGQIFFRFPVSWEVLRSGFNTLNVALEAETFAETWALYVLSPEAIYLISPHGKTSVVGIQSQGISDAPFDTLLLSEQQLASLLGIQHKALEGSEKWIFLELPVRDNQVQTFTLAASPRYFISVSIHIVF